MTPPVSTFRVDRPCGGLSRRARYRVRPSCLKVAEVIAARRPAAALDPGDLCDPDSPRYRAGQGACPMWRAA